MADQLNRIVCDSLGGGWGVMFGGRMIKKRFPVAEEALQHLEALKRKREQPEYEA